jgi:hypothetical protein
LVQQTGRYRIGLSTQLAMPTSSEIMGILCHPYVDIVYPLGA